MAYDVIIIGTGVAGLTASVYGVRAGLSILVLRDKYSVGSQICDTYEVCNYMGLNNISGQELYDRFLSHAKSFNVEIKDEKALEILEYDKEIKVIKTKEHAYETKNIILATGATNKKGGFAGEEKFIGNGVSYCATCDGAFYKDKIVAVIGGGNVACEDAIFLSRVAKYVYVIVRKDKMRAEKILQDELLSKNNVEVLYETVVDSVIGDDKFLGVNIRGVDSKITSELCVAGVFVGIGIEPDSSLLSGKVEMSDDNYIIADEDCKTSVPGIYVAGDVRKKPLRQVVTASSDGANAIASIIKK